MFACIVVSVNEDKPIFVAEAAESTGYTWINNLPFPRYSANYSLTVVWQGRYGSDAGYLDTLRRPAKPWIFDGRDQCTRSNNCVDDSYDDTKYMRLLSSLSLFVLHTGKFAR